MTHRAISTIILSMSMTKEEFAKEVKRLRLALGWDPRSKMSENFYGIPVDTVKNWELARWMPKGEWEKELILDELRRRLKK